MNPLRKYQKHRANNENTDINKIWVEKGFPQIIYFKRLLLLNNQKPAHCKTPHVLTHLLFWTSYGLSQMRQVYPTYALHSAING